MVTADEDSVTVDLLDPASGIAPGQAVVVYDGSRVVGSATISRTLQATGATQGTTRVSAATGIGSMPGEDFGAAVRLVVDELPDLPHLPELPDRGTIADLTGRGVAVIGELGFDLQPAGWRLTDSPGVDHRRAKSLLAQDLDVLEEELRGLPAVSSRSRSPGRGRSPRRSRSPAATRCSPTTAPAVSWRRHSPRGSASTSRTCSDGCPAPRWCSSSTSRRCRSSSPARCRPPRGSTGTARSRRRWRRTRWSGFSTQRGRRPPSCTAAPLTCPSRCCAGPGPGESPSTSRFSARVPTRSWRRRWTRVPGCSSAWCRRRAARLRRPRARSSAPCGCWTCSASTRKRSPTSWCSRLRAGWPVPSPSYAKEALRAVRTAAAELG